MKTKYWQRREVGPIEAIHPMTKKVITVHPQLDAMIRFDLDTELTRLPGLVSWWMSLRDTAEERLRDAKHAEHNAHEDLDAELRAKHPKSVTETALKMLVKKDPRMRKAFRERMDAESMHRRLKSAVEAVLEKHWSLQSLSREGKRERAAKDYAKE